MAFKAAEALAKALREEGPPILRTPFVHGKTSESRLQLAPDALHSADNDPHREGRAVDIVLLSNDPSQKAEADELVRLFRRMVDTMQWGWLIYNKRQWSPTGAETPRLFRAKNADETPAEYTDRKTKFEHVTHIHVEWENHKKDLDDFADDLVAELTSEEGGLLGTLDAVPDALNGTWDVTIGNGAWTGVFKFTRAGGVTWGDDEKSKPGGTGRWSIEADRNLIWRFGGGDIRTFAAELPPDPSKTNGVIRPQGQGWFTMSKR
jgi:hypothetical protein